MIKNYFVIAIVIIIICDVVLIYLFRRMAQTRCVMDSIFADFGIYRLGW